MEAVQVDMEKLYELMAVRIVKEVCVKSLDKIKKEEKSDSEAYVKDRKHLNIKRWNCISRPQYKYSCGISSVVSCWNYLFSTLGYGELKPLTQEEALKILGFTEPFDNIRFGPFTGNTTLMNWFNKLNAHFGLFGKASFFYKPVGSNKTFGLIGNMAKQRLQTLLKTKDSAFIYHCYNHYCCPIGYEREPISADNIYYNNSLDENQEFLDWIIIADTSRKYQQFHCVKWEDIERDLNCKSPEYLNIRHLERGVQQNSYSKKAEKNLHCLMLFKKLQNETFFFSDIKFSYLSEEENTVNHD